MLLLAAMTTKSVTGFGLMLYRLGTFLHFIGKNFGLIELQ